MGVSVGYVEVGSKQFHRPLSRLLIECFRLSSPADPVEDLISFFRASNVLLVLDTPYALPQDDSKLLKMLLRECPKIKVLSTSYTALNLSSIHNIAIKPLSLPTKKDMNRLTQSEANLSQHSAIQLFLDRSELPKQLSSDKLLLVVKIARRLSGVPLALILVAAQTKHRTLEAIEADTNLLNAKHPFEDLVVPGRHVSMQAALHSSIDPLPS